MEQLIDLGKPFRHRELLKKNVQKKQFLYFVKGKIKWLAFFLGKIFHNNLNFHQFKCLNLCFALNEELPSQMTNTDLFKYCKAERKRSIKILTCWLSKIIFTDNKLPIKKLVSFFKTEESTRSLVINWETY